MHHANLLIGGREWALGKIGETDTTPGQDVSVTHYERMNIKDVRALQHEAMLRPVSKAYRSFVISTDSILHEAQNALLKLFEEPNEHTIFYFIIPQEDMLLPTLRSRFALFAVETKESDQSVLNAFLKLGYHERLALITEKLAEEDSMWVTELLKGLTVHAEKSRDAKLIEELLMVMAYMQTSGSSKKMLLEHMALSL